MYVYMYATVTHFNNLPKTENICFIFQILTINFRNDSHLMKKSCLKSANDEDAHQSMHPVRTVGSVHATNKHIENELSHTQRQVFSQNLKCSAQDLSVDLLDMRDTQIYPFSH